MDPLVEEAIPGLSFAEFKRSIAVCFPFFEKHSSAILLTKVGTQSFLEAAAEDHRCPCLLFTPSIPITVASGAAKVLANLRVATDHLCQNSITHGIFVKKFLSRTTAETAAEIEVLAGGIRDHYQPVGMLEELLVQKIVLAREHRVLGVEQEFDGGPMPLVARLGLMARYTTSISRVLFHAIEEMGSGGSCLTHETAKQTRSSHLN
jgi:hypothetical protein